MKARPLSWRLSLPVLLLLGSPALAADYYVDASGGSDAHTGTSWTDAWKTISHAMAMIPSGPNDVHIAAGVYDEAMGETFPIAIRSELNYVAEGGQAIVDGAGTSGSLFRYLWSVSDVSFQGLWLRNAGFGIALPGARNGSLSLTDVVISDMTVSGIHIQAYFDGIDHMWFDVDVTRTRIFDCSEGIWIEALCRDIDLYDCGIQLTCTDSEIYQNVHGLVTWTDPEWHYGNADARLEISGCRIHDNVRGVGQYNAATPVTVESTVFDSNGVGFLGSGSAAELTNCTIVSSTNEGVVGTTAATVGLRNCIVYGNGDDLSGSVSAAYCDIGDGDYAGTNGNISADPLFLDAANGDYRLLLSSPCVDAGDPTLGPDCDGTVADMGAFPLAFCPPEFCYGDGTGAACPCGNTGLPGHGCDNAQGTGGVRLEAIHFTPDSQGGGSVQLIGTGFNPPAFPAAIVIRSPEREGAPVFLGDGLRCVSTTSLTRMAARLAAGGSSSHSVGHGVGPGSFNYQLWYRNQPIRYCDPVAAFNTSNGLTLTWP